MPEIPSEPQEAAFTKAPPPAYRAAGKFPNPTAQPQDLPPPYAGPTAAFAYPPQAANVTPYPTAPAPSGPSYPQFEPSAPSGPEYPSATQFDPAYPPPNVSAQPQELPYPVDLGFGGGAYPPPTGNNDTPS